MTDAGTSSALTWPFFTDTHRAFAASLRDWTVREIAPLPHPSAAPADVDAACRAIVRRLGDGGWLRYSVPAPHGGVYERLDVRTLCLARETLAQVSGLAEFVFALQGLGVGPISLFGSDALKARYLPAVARGDAIAAFAISESEAGSDVNT